MGAPRGPIGKRVVDPALVSVASPLAAPVGLRRPRSRDTEAPHGGPDEVDDASLVAAILAGERRAEEMLYRRYAPSVLRLATRLLRSNEDGMDVLQDAFVTAFEDVKSLRDHDAFRGWIHWIAVRLVHRRFRRRRPLGWLGLGGSEDVSLETLADETVSQESRMELRWLDEALARVDDCARSAWMLRHVEGLTLDEIAAVCDCSLATAKRRIACADAVVQRHFDEPRGAR